MSKQARIVLAVLLCVSACGKVLWPENEMGPLFFWRVGWFVDVGTLESGYRGLAVGEIAVALSLLWRLGLGVVAALCWVGFMVGLSVKVYVATIDVNAMSSCGCFGAITRFIPWQAMLALDALGACLAVVVLCGHVKGNGFVVIQDVGLKA
jgi:hypothetical protein